MSRPHKPNYRDFSKYVCGLDCETKSQLPDPALADVNKLNCKLFRRLASDFLNLRQVCDIIVTVGLCLCYCFGLYAFYRTHHLPYSLLIPSAVIQTQQNLTIYLFLKIPVVCSRHTLLCCFPFFLPCMWWLGVIAVLMF